MSQRKWIAISQETYRDLAQKGTVTDSFDDVLKRLLKSKEKEGKQEVAAAK